MGVFETLARGLAALAVAAASLLPSTVAQAAGANVIANPGFETASGSAPASWSKDSWGTNTPTFTYENTGHTGSRSATVKLANYKTGDAKWYFTSVAVTPNTKYTFSDWYKSTAVSGIDMVVTTTANKTSYVHAADPATSSAWKQQVYSFTAPANAKSVTFYHYLDKNGTLTVDDYSLTADDGTTPPPANTPPTVSVTSPAAAANLTGTVNVTANASDDKAVKNVQFKLDGNNLGAADTAAPYSVSWDTTTATKGNHVLTAVATDSDNATTTSAAVSVNVDNTVVTPTPPAVNITAPAANATVSGKTVAISAEASSAQGIKNVQFKLDGQNIGTADTSVPYSINWDSTSVSNGQHYFSATATTNAGLSATSSNVTVTVNNQAAPTAPTVSVTAPTANATVSGKTVALSANASDAQAVKNVQFKVDGNNVGAADTAAPYSATWDSTAVANGNHTVTAVATNTSNLTTTSSAVTVNVQNQVVTPPATGNLIANPSVETAANGVPTGWTNDSWGTNTHAFTYENSGQDGSHSIKTNVTKYTSGDAKWYFTPVNVTPNQSYDYTEYYKSNVDSEVDAMVTLNDGTVAYYYLGAPAAASNWTKLSYSFTAPANAKTVTIFHVVSKVGYVQSDNFFFGTYTPAQFNRALVSLTFDDGWRSIATNGLPLLKKYGLVSTQYLNSQPVMDAYPDYMTYDMIKDFKTQGSELAWHTQTHADLTKATATQLNTELTIPQAFLTGTGTTAADFKNFATPYGAYNSTAINAIMAKYRSHRSTDVGYNSKDNFDITNIKVQNIEATTTPADVQNWVSQAAATKTWLVIVYHEVDTNPEDKDYYVTPANLDSELNIVKQSGVTVKTVEQALDEVTAQL